MTDQKPAPSTTKQLAYWAGVIILSAIVLLGLRALHNDLNPPISPKNLTLSAITETFVRIDMYAQEHKALPPSFDPLPRRQNHMNRITDAWGRPLQFSLADGIITLTSYGKDGKPGGSEEDEDIFERHYATHEDGSLWVGNDPLWLVKSNVKDCPRPADGQRDAYYQSFCK